MECVRSSWVFKIQSSFQTYSQVTIRLIPPKKKIGICYSRTFTDQMPLLSPSQQQLLLQIWESMLPRWIRNASEVKLTDMILKAGACMFEQDDDFDSTTGLLSGSLKRINFMVNSGRGNRKLMCYLILGLVALFFIMFYVISWLRTSWLYLSLYFPYSFVYVHQIVL